MAIRRIPAANAPTVFTGTLTANRDVTLQAGNSARTAFFGQITGSGSVYVTSPFGNRRLVLQRASAPANNFAGDVYIQNNAILQLGSSQSIQNLLIPDSADVHFANDASELRFASCPAVSPLIETVNWAADSSNDGQGTGTLGCGTISVDYSTNAGEGNAGMTLSTNWQTSPATDGVAGAGRLQDAAADD